MEAIKLNVGFPEWGNLSAFIAEINANGGMFAYGIDHNTVSNR